MSALAQRIGARLEVVAKMRSGRLQHVVLYIALLGSPAWAADTALQLRRAQSSPARVAQDQQFVYQQAQIAQTLLRVEESRRLVTQSPTELLPPPRFELIQRDERASSLRVQQFQEELDRLHARYRELDDQRRWLDQTRNTRMLQRIEDP